MASCKIAFLQKVKTVKNCLDDGVGLLFVCLKEKIMQNCLHWCFPSKTTPVDKQYCSVNIHVSLLWLPAF